jgi:hypothetical protein
MTQKKHMGRLRSTVKVTGSGTLAQQDTLIEEAAAWFFLYARFNGTTAARTLDKPTAS